MKFTSIFFTASAQNIRYLLQTGEKYEVYFDIFHSECPKYSIFISNIINIINYSQIFLKLLQIKIYFI